MEAINPNAQLVSIFGPPEYNNFNEPVPFSNQPRCLIGFTTAFLVSVLPYHLVVTSRLRWHRCRFAIRRPDLLTPVFRRLCLGSLCVFDSMFASRSHECQVSMISLWHYILYASCCPPSSGMSAC